MGAGIIEFISNIVNITGNPIADTVIFAIIGSISASIAFGFVKILFNFTGKHNFKDMSDVHWGVRVFIFALLTFILVKIAQFFRWLFTPPQAYCLIGSIIIIILAIIFTIKHRSKKNIQVDNNISTLESQYSIKNEEKQPEAITRNVSSNQDNCPFCGGKLVQRKGPYGRFLGCSNYPKCKYTRNNQ
jgi:ABC-type Fe3+-siderophore transport system permease subunit